MDTSPIDTTIFSVIFCAVCLFLGCKEKYKNEQIALLDIKGQKKVLLHKSKNSNREHNYVWLEGEDGIARDINSLIIVNDTSSSNGAYITEPNGKVVVPINIEVQGKYHLYGRFFAQDYNNDSFTMAFFDNAGNEIFGGVWNNINSDNQKVWAWDICRIGVEKEQEIISLDLETGKYTLEIYPRDANEIKIVRFLLTMDSKWSEQQLKNKSNVFVEAEVGPFTAPFSNFIEPEASENTAIAMQAANATYDFTISKPGTYQILGYTYGKDAQSDSMFIIIDNAPMEVWHFSSDKIWNNWKWSGYEEGHYFDEGVHKIQLVQRETEAKLDAILLTDDMDLVSELMGIQQ